MIPIRAADAADGADPDAAKLEAANPDAANPEAPTWVVPTRDEARRAAVTPEGDTQEVAAPGWTFLTNHAHVLVALARDPAVRLRDVALLVGITERSVQSIVADLEAAGYLRRVRVGRRNRYQVNPAGPLRHPAERDHAVGELLELFTNDSDGRRSSAAADGVAEAARATDDS